MVRFFCRGRISDKNIQGSNTFKRLVAGKNTDSRKQMVPGTIAPNSPYNNISPSSNMAGYANGASTPMEGYHNSKHYNFSNNGQTSPSSRAGYQSREPRSAGDQKRRSKSSRSGSKSRNTQQGRDLNFHRHHLFQE